MAPPHSSKSSSLPLHASRSSIRKPNRGTLGHSNTKKKGPIQVFVYVMLFLIFLMVAFTFIAVATHTHPPSDTLIPEGSYRRADEGGVLEPNVQTPTQPRRRTSAEATAAMERQPSHNVDGEKSLRAKLYPLYELQQQGKELGSKIVTRWLGRSDLDYWFPKSREEEDAHGFRTWQDIIVDEREEMRVKDVALNPSLYNLADAELEKQNYGAGDGGSVNETQNSKPKITFTHPAPTNTHVSLKPTFGTHRSHSDAIFAFAEGYDLKIYLTFLESLKATGYNGDLVLSVSALDKLKPGVEEYLRSHHKEENEVGLNVVVYTVTWLCYTGDGELAEGANEGQRMCELVGMYSTEDGGEVKDPRDPRPVATARYELYWAWSLNYDPHSWSMLIDSRDAFFQKDPFAALERAKDNTSQDGLLYFFGVSFRYLTSVVGFCNLLTVFSSSGKCRCK